MTNAFVTELKEWSELIIPLSVSLTFLKKSSWTLRLTRTTAACPLRSCWTSQTTSVHHDLLQFYTRRRKHNTQRINICANAEHWYLLCCVALPGASPVCHCASCLQDGRGARLSGWPWAGPGRSARCSSRPWPVRQFKYVRCNLNKATKCREGHTTHVVWENLSDSHEDAVSCSHRGQMQSQLQITHRVTAEVLQLQIKNGKKCL